MQQLSLPIGAVVSTRRTNVSNVFPDRLTTPGSGLGEIYTKRWIAEWMLDLVGYTPEQDLASRTIIEPSCGTGAFLIPIVRRLMLSEIDRDRIRSLASAIWATDLQEDSVSMASKLVIEELMSHGVCESDSEFLAASWLHTSDFLLGEVPPGDWVVGNPPYVRLEDVDSDLMTQYRAACSTMAGRADLYVGFFERALGALRPAGSVAFICADRWMRNSYGKRLRQLIVDGDYSVDATVELHDVDCFVDAVAAYPAIAVISKRAQRRGVVARTSSSFGDGDAEDVTSFVSSRSRRKKRSTWEASRLDGWFDAGLWPEGSPEAIEFVNSLESSFPAIEDGHADVGIGVASGADSVFIVTDEDLVEPDRLLPLAMSRHIASGDLEWEPTFLVNPWEAEGLVDLDRFPRLATYLLANEALIRKRHVARKQPARWYRTIDRVNVDLTTTEKILMSDMRARITPVVERGDLYPHHNLYWVTSQDWPMDSLAGLLLSDFANLVVQAYCVKMRAGTLRFQAQYLRKIRIPELEGLSDSVLEELARASKLGSIGAANAAAERAYGITLPLELQTAVD